VPNPKISVLVRANYFHEIAALRQAGADHVLTGEGEVALAMTEFVLRHLGATPEQIDHERDRIRGELFGGDKPAEIVEKTQMAEAL
jgi:CPA2 family monovalent cation:H+ antiporter-2